MQFIDILNNSFKQSLDELLNNNAAKGKRVNFEQSLPSGASVVNYVNSVKHTKVKEKTERKKKEKKHKSFFFGDLESDSDRTIVNSAIASSKNKIKLDPEYFKKEDFELSRISAPSRFFSRVVDALGQIELLIEGRANCNQRKIVERGQKLYIF